MNYKRAIEILEAVQKLRDEKKNRSPYVCDNLEEAIEQPAKEQKLIMAIQDDIASMINKKFSVVEYLEDRDRHGYRHSDDTVINFRKELIETLIIRYKDKIQQTQGA